MSNVYTFSGGALTEGIQVTPRSDGNLAVRAGSLERGQAIRLSEDVICENCLSGKLLLKNGVVERIEGVPRFVHPGQEPAPHSYLLVQTAHPAPSQHKKVRRSGTWSPLRVQTRAQSTVKEILRGESGGKEKAPEFLLLMHEGDSIVIRPLGVSPEDRVNTFVISCSRKADGSLALSCESLQSMRKRAAELN